MLGIRVSLALLLSATEHTFRLAAGKTCSASAADPCITKSRRLQLNHFRAGQLRRLLMLRGRGGGSSGATWSK